MLFPLPGPPSSCSQEPGKLMLLGHLLQEAFPDQPSWASSRLPGAYVSSISAPIILPTNCLAVCLPHWTVSLLSGQDRVLATTVSPILSTGPYVQQELNK